MVCCWVGGQANKRFVLVGSKTLRVWASGELARGWSALDGFHHHNHHHQCTLLRSVRIQRYTHRKRENGVSPRCSLHPRGVPLRALDAGTAAQLCALVQRLCVLYAPFICSYCWQHVDAAWPRKSVGSMSIPRFGFAKGRNLLAAPRPRSCIVLSSQSALE